jgi:hypothetical protein
MNGWPASSSVGGSAGPKLPTFGWVQNQFFDPAEAQFFSLLSYGAMSEIAPTIFGDFQSPIAVSYSPVNWSGPITPDTTGLDAAASTMVNGAVQQGLLPTGGALMADAFGVGSSSEVASDGAAPTQSTNGPDSSVDDTMATDTASGSTIGANGIESSCGTEVPNKLQAGGQYWNSEGAGPGPVQFPPGVFTRGGVGNPLGDLGPSGDRSNVTGPGPGGDWCRPGHAPFSLSSPLETDIFWIMLSIVLAALLVAWLSRSHRLPAI